MKYHRPWRSLRLILLRATCYSHCLMHYQVTQLCSKYVMALSHPGKKSLTFHQSLQAAQHHADAMRKPDAPSEAPGLTATSATASCHPMRLLPVFAGLKPIMRLA